MQLSPFVRFPPLAVGLAIAAPGVAADQAATWLNPITGLWSEATGWSSDPLVPNEGNGGFTYDVVIDASGTPYVVTVDEATTLENFVLDSADATLWIDAA